MKKKFFGLLSVILSFCFLFSGCQWISDQAAGLLDAKCSELINYFNEIALYPKLLKSNTIERWEEPIYLKISGDYSEEDYSTLTNFVDRFNSLGLTQKITIVDEKYNFEVYFYPYIGGTDWYASNVRTNNDAIYNVYIRIANDEPTQKERNYIILFSITDAIGLRYISDKYPDSIFHPEWTKVQTLSDMDFELIRMLYSPSLHAGMNEEEAKEALLPMVRAKYIDNYLD